MSGINPEYQCPNCQFTLSKKNKIELSTIRMNGDKGKLYLSTDRGDFLYDHEPATFFEKGETVHLFCPECETNLKSSRFNGFSKLIYKKTNEQTEEVFISNVAGKRKMYILSHNGLEAYMEK